MSEHTTIIVDAYLRMDAVNLYNNAVLPLLEMLECDNIVPTATYNTYTTTEQLMSAILLPLLSWVEDTVAVEPVSTVLELLPKFAYIMEFGFIGEILKATKLNRFWISAIPSSATGYRIIKPLCSHWLA